MYEQINTQFANFSKQFADSALKANAIALANAERLFGLQVKTAEAQFNSAIEFFGEAVEVRDFEAARSFFPKGVEWAKASAERFIAAGQEGFGQSMKTGEAIAELVRGSFDFDVARPAAKASRAAK